MGKDRCWSKREVIIFVEFVFEVVLWVGELGRVRVMKNEKEVVVINGKIVLSFDEIIKFVNSSDNNVIVMVLYIGFEGWCGLRWIESMGREGVILFDSVIVKVVGM